MQHVCSQFRMCAIAQKYHLMKGTLDVAVAIVTRHVYTEAEMRVVCASKAGEAGWNIGTAQSLHLYSFSISSRICSVQGKFVRKYYSWLHGPIEE